MVAVGAGLLQTVKAGRGHCSQKRFRLSVEQLRLADFAVQADRTNRSSSDRHYADCRKCNMRSNQTRQMSRFRDHSGHLVAVDLEPESGMGNHHIDFAERLDAEFAGRKAHIPSE